MYSLPPELLLMITSVSCTIIMIFNAIFAKKVSNDGLDVWFYTAFTTLSAFISATIILIISNVNFYFSLFSVLISLIFSAMITLNTFATIKASKIGSLSYTSIIASLSCIIPTLISRFFFNETISIPQYIGMALIVVCIVLSTERDSANKKASIKWLCFAILAFLTAGAMGVIQKTHQSSLYKDELAAFLLPTFLFSFAISVAVYSFKSKKVIKKGKPTLSQFVIPLSSGVCFALCHSINLKLSGQIPAIIFFPVVNVTPMILFMLIAVVFFKERLSKTRWIGIATGLVATVLLSGII